MAEPGREQRGLRQTSVTLPGGGAEALAEAATLVTQEATLDGALRAIAEGAAGGARADLAVVRVLDRERGVLAARAVFARSTARAAEVEGSQIPLGEIELAEIDDAARLPAAVRQAAARGRFGVVLQVPAAVNGEIVGTLELMRMRKRFEEGERLLARLAASQLRLALHAFEPARDGVPAKALELVGEALAAGADDDGRLAYEIARLAASATGASCSALWSVADAAPALAGSFGLPSDGDALRGARELAARALQSPFPVALDSLAAPPAADAEIAATLPLGRPAVGVLQLFFPGGVVPSERDLAGIATFGARAASALHSASESRAHIMELAQTRALLRVVGQAIAQLSLTHTLETAVERVSVLLEAQRVAIYLREDDRIVARAARGLSGPHEKVAERLLELALGPFRARGLILVEDLARDRRLGGYEGSAAEAGIESAVAMPLVVRDDAIGLLAVYPERGRVPTQNESAFLSALALQLAAAVQNARLHEQAKELGSELEQALASEREAARQLAALYEISRSFAQSLSLETTLEAVARTVVELLAVDAAVIRMPDPRGETLVPCALHVADPTLEQALRALVERPESFAASWVKTIFERRQPLVLERGRVGDLDVSHRLLGPFLEKGSTAVVLPIATPAEVLASLTLVSVDPARPITEGAIRMGLAVAGQAALAIDNARLYQQQKAFFDTMQRSLLPRSRPQVRGLDLGEAYESSARVDVGGDVYDFLSLADGRLAVVLGDVTGHGIDAAADMAMAKFVFRSLAREHPEPGDFLAHANDVVVGELALGKFITMLYLAVDADRGEVACSSAGHPAPRLLRADGTVKPLVVQGLALGVERNQVYGELRERFEPASAVVLYTDGVVEARRNGELYGEERLDRLLAERRGLGAKELALAVLADCRAFSGGELTDDCAVVVVKRPG